MAEKISAKCRERAQIYADIAALDCAMRIQRESPRSALLVIAFVAPIGTAPTITIRARIHFEIAD